MGMFGHGFGQKLLGGIDAMTQRWGEMNGDQGALTRLQLQQQGAQQQAMLQREMALAAYKNQNPDPTGTMQNVQAAGLQPGTPEYQAFMQKMLMQPHYMVLGNAENGQQIVDPSQMGGSPGIAPPKVGEVQDGHVYMGGDPSNPASWKAQ